MGCFGPAQIQPCGLVTRWAVPDYWAASVVIRPINIVTQQPGKNGLLLILDPVYRFDKKGMHNVVLIIEVSSKPFLSGKLIKLYLFKGFKQF